MQIIPTRFPLVRPFRNALSLLLLTTSLHAETAEVFPANPTAWPAVSKTNKPWTRWWWLGSAVDKANLTQELEAFAKAGLGGVEICPIYGAVGAEKRFIDFLSPDWMEMLAHTTTEAKRLGLGVDMTTGTGWPFGGPTVTPQMASCGLERITSQVSGGKKISLKLPEGQLQCLRAFPEAGDAVDLTQHVKSGLLEWNPPAGKWTISGLSAKSEIQQVKRAAPGGQGNVLDPFSPAAMNRYLATFDKAFTNFSAPKPRAHFHDSFEYYGADWAPGFFESFQSARGYDLRDQLPAFNGIGDSNSIARVRADYRQTLGELHRDYLKAWHDWTRNNDGITRNQAHGSPGNLLDHYSVSEIPETEIFRHVGENQIPMIRFATSAAHANGGTLVSSETFTWLGEHFQITPEALKEAADFVFLGGVNHIFFHGIPYSPNDAPWPGWLFYASTHMGPNGGLWHDLPAFTGYLQRCQSILQDGKPDSEVLLYFPFADTIQGGEEKLPLFTMHNQEEWLYPTQFHKTAMEFWEQGITFDYASDDMLLKASVKHGRIILGNNAFKVLVMPDVKHMPVATMEMLANLSAQGGKVVFYSKDSSKAMDVPGFHEHEQRKAALNDLMMKHFAKVTDSLIPALENDLGVTHEPMVASGLRFVRQTHAEGFTYFIVNRSAHDFAGNLPLTVPFKSAVILDPWHPESNAVTASGKISLRLAPLQSIIIRTFTAKTVTGKPWTPPGEIANSFPLDGPWKLEFIDGGPVLPAATELLTLTSWSTFPDPPAKNFSGTARYSTSFDFTGSADSSVRLDLGKVANSARVSLNGSPIGISWCEPHELDLTGHLKSGRNELAIEVTNLAANRIADLDRRKVPWKQFHEINFVNIDYEPFDASTWPAMDSGLLGPVRLLVETRPR